MSPSLSWFERDELSALLQQVGLPERSPASDEPKALMPPPLEALAAEGTYEVTVENRFRSMAKRDAGRFASSASTQPGPVPGPCDDDFDKKATRLAAGQVTPPVSFPQGGTLVGEAPHTEDGPPPRKRHSEWGGSAAAHREQAHGDASDKRRRRGKKGGTITAPPSSSDPLSSDFPSDSEDLASSRSGHIPPFVAPLGPVWLRLEAMLQWCIGLGPLAGTLEGAAVADQEGLPVAIKLLRDDDDEPQESWMGGPLEAALSFLETDGPIREGQLLLHRPEGPLSVVWVPSMAGSRWYLLMWGAEPPRAPALHAMIDAFRELCRRAVKEADAS